MKPRLTFLIVLLLAFVGVWLLLLWLEHSYAEKPYSFIEERLYVGRAVPKPPPGTKAVLNLCDSVDPYEVDVYRSEPIDGSLAPTVEWMWRVVRFIEAQRQAGRITYIHCLAGVNRSGMVVTAYLMYEHNWSRDQALAFARSKRPEIWPNSTLMQALTEWEEALKNRQASEL